MTVKLIWMHEIVISLFIIGLFINLYKFGLASGLIYTPSLLPMMTFRLEY